MDRIEIDSFVNKFRALCDAGYNASLNLESKLGEVFVNLSCKVGRTTPPPPFTSPHLSMLFPSIVVLPTTDVKLAVRRLMSTNL